MVRLNRGKFKRDVNVVFTAVPRSVLLPDSDEIGKRAPVLNTAHLSKAGMSCPKIVFDFLASQSGPEVPGICLES